MPEPQGCGPLAPRERTAIKTIIRFRISQRRQTQTLKEETLEFTTSSGTKIRKAGLFFIPLVIVSFIIAGILSLKLTGAKNIEDSLLTQMLIAFFAALLPSLYCIIRNFPISVYFHKNAWYVEGANTYSSNDSFGRSHNSFSRDVSQINSPYNRRHNPINNYSATNSHYRR